MGSINTLINWYEQRKGKVLYSMANRNGLSSYDCSSALYFALRTSRFLPNNLMGNTDDLFGDLESNGFSITNSPVKGDIFIWGRRGASGGYYGNCGIFTDDGTTIIHCNHYYNGITENTYASMYSNYQNPPATFYHNPNDDEEETEILSNIGELELLGIKNGEVIAEGWHFSSGYNTEYIVFMNAVTNNEISRILAPPINRPDLAEQYPNVEGIENSGFSVSMAVPNGTSVYIKGIRTNGTNSDELIFPKIITFEQAFDIDINYYAETNTKFFFEIYNDDTLLVRGNKMLSTLSWSLELMSVPSIDIVLPIEYAEYIKGREEVKLYINNKVFHGFIYNHILDKQNETIQLAIEHVIGEWDFRQISTNLACKERTINDIYSTLDFRYPGWNINYLQNAGNEIIDYVYSRQSKLNGLTKTCELTADLFWRVGFDFGRKLEIGSFGEELPYIISTKKSGGMNIRMISEPVITHNYESVINIATVYGEKSDSGMSSMSLREVYEEEGAQDPNFPVVILRHDINNERVYDYVQFHKLAPNNDIEYTVMDVESIAIENGIIIEGTYSMNDLAPFNDDGKQITDEDRALAAMTAYEATIKKLKESRRQLTIEVVTEQLPYDVTVGDKIRLIYENDLWFLGECSNYMKKILSQDDYFYITSINYDIDANGVETNTISLDKFLYLKRETDAQ